MRAISGPFAVQMRTPSLCAFGIEGQGQMSQGIALGCGKGGRWCAHVARAPPRANAEKQMGCGTDTEKSVPDR